MNKKMLSFAVLAILMVSMAGMAFAQEKNEIKNVKKIKMHKIKELEPVKMEKAKIDFEKVPFDEDGGTGQGNYSKGHMLKVLNNRLEYLGIAKGFLPINRHISDAKKAELSAAIDKETEEINTLIEKIINAKGAPELRKLKEEFDTLREKVKVTLRLSSQYFSYMMLMVYRVEDLERQQQFMTDTIKLLEENGIDLPQAKELFAKFQELFLAAKTDLEAAKAKLDAIDPLNSNRAAVAEAKQALAKASGKFNELKEIVKKFREVVEPNIEN